MTNIMEEGLIIFNSTHDSIKVDSLCEDTNFPASLVPTHPSISAGCGFMLKTSWDQFEKLLTLLEENNVEYKNKYYSRKIGLKRIVKLLEDN